MEKKKDFGKIIIEARKKKGLSQSDLAKIIHVTRQAISRWENGILLCE